MADYKPEYIEKLVAKMMTAANRAVLDRVLFWGGLGAAIGYAAGIMAPFVDGEEVAALGACVGAVLGFTSAQSLALQMRAQAQLMLTQLEIEKNTRPLRRSGANKQQAT